MTDVRYGSREWGYLLASDIDRLAAAYASGSLYERDCKRICERAADMCRWRARHAPR